MIAIAFVLIVLALTSSLFPSLALAADPSGEETLLKNPGLPVDYVWILLCGFLVMFMQAGFAMCSKIGDFWHVKIRDFHGTKSKISLHPTTKS
jgi:hypothetical protein